MRFFLRIALVLALFFPGFTRAAESVTDAEIQYLLNYVRTAELVFIRNGKQHTPEEAYRHMLRKYGHFKKKIDSAESFIEYSATKSTMSGKKYVIRLPDGNEEFAQDYLLDELSRFREQAGS